MFETRHEAKGAIFRLIEGFYNRARVHSAIGYHSLIEWEQVAATA